MTIDLREGLRCTKRSDSCRAFHDLTHLICVCMSGHECVRPVQYEEHMNDFSARGDDPLVQEVAQNTAPSAPLSRRPYLPGARITPSQNIVSLSPLPPPSHLPNGSCLAPDVIAIVLETCPQNVIIVWPLLTRLSRLIVCASLYTCVLSFRCNPEAIEGINDQCLSRTGNLSHTSDHTKKCTIL